jgi:hypothetical protein
LREDEPAAESEHDARFAWIREHELTAEIQRELGQVEVEAAGRADTQRVPDEGGTDEEARGFASARVIAGAELAPERVEALPAKPFTVGLSRSLSCQ